MALRWILPTSCVALCLAAAPATRPATVDRGADVAPDAVVAVPAGVNYKPASAAVNAKAIALVHQLCSPTATDDQLKAAFDEVLICGPGLWDQMKTDPALAAVHHGDVTLLVAAGGADAAGKLKAKGLHGAVFQGRADAVTFWKAVRAKADLSHVAVRKLTPAELNVYWGMISFDLTEPIFVADCGRQHLLLDFTAPDKLQVLWADDLAAYPAANPTTAPATRP